MSCESQHSLCPRLPLPMKEAGSGAPSLSEPPLALISLFISCAPPRATPAFIQFLKPVCCLLLMGLSSGCFVCLEHISIHPSSGNSYLPLMSLLALWNPAFLTVPGWARSVFTLIVPITLVIALIVTGFLSVPPLSSMFFPGRVHVLFVLASQGQRSDT